MDMKGHEVADEEQALAEETLASPASLAKVEAERTRVLAAVSSNAPDRVLDRVAWILNHYPEARDSDVKCQIIYWKTFQADLYSGGDISIDSYPKLQRFNSISRARATVQNILKLFIASPEVRKFRGKLEEHEKQQALEVRPSHPVYSIYGDESGKTSRYLVVGSIWVLRSYDTMKISRAIAGKKKSLGMSGEVHFKDINKNNLSNYIEVLNTLVENSSSVSFKGLAIPRSGIGNVDEMLTKLFYHMLIDGVREEDVSGRAILPRSLQFRKDSEEASKDIIILKDIRLNLEHAALSTFGNRLYIDVVDSEDSATSPLMQMADLFVSSVSRILNGEPQSDSPKDKFAKEFLGAFGMSVKEGEMEGVSQCVRLVKL